MIHLVYVLVQLRLHYLLVLLLELTILRLKLILHLPHLLFVLAASHEVLLDVVCKFGDLFCQFSDGFVLLLNLQLQLSDVHLALILQCVDFVLELFSLRPQCLFRLLLCLSSIGHFCLKLFNLFALDCCFPAHVCFETLQPLSKQH